MKYIIPIFAFLILFSCNPCADWDKEKKVEFSQNCQQTSILKSLTISLKGFDIEELQPIKIFESSNDSILDTLNIYYKKPDHNSVREFTINIKNRIKLKNSYHFKIGSNTYYLEDLTLGMEPEFTMCKKDYGCHLISYKLNKQTFVGYKFIMLNKN